MLKKDNLITKFRTLWKSLTDLERERLWDILTALRGCDRGENDDVKYMTTARIRGELLGENYSRGYVFIKFKQAKEMINTWSQHGEYYKAKEVKAHFQEKSSHFKSHIRHAIDALFYYRPKSAIRDLQKFLRF